MIFSCLALFLYVPIYSFGHDKKEKVITIHAKGCFYKTGMGCDAIETTDGKIYGPIFRTRFVHMMNSIYKPSPNSFIEFEAIDVSKDRGGYCLAGPIIEVIDWNLISKNCQHKEKPMSTRAMPPTPTPQNKLIKN